jgi:hypothetical protein
MSESTETRRPLLKYASEGLRVSFSTALSRSAVTDRKFATEKAWSGHPKVTRPHSQPCIFSRRSLSEAVKARVRARARVQRHNRSSGARVMARARVKKSEG